jgi:hypothetical protein
MFLLLCMADVIAQFRGVCQLQFFVVAAHVSLLSFSNPASKKDVSEKLPQSVLSLRSFCFYA